VDSNGFQVFMGEKKERTQYVKHAEGEAWSTLPHIENFLKAVRSRKRSDLNCDILEGHISATLCHLANASYRLERSLSFDPERENFGSDSEANTMLTRNYRDGFVVPAKV
jgi:hypothetical protein